MKIKIKHTSEEPLEEQVVKPRARKNQKAVGNASDNKKKNNVHYILYFLAAVFTCIVFALIFRTIVMVKNSTFSTPSYAVLFSSSTPFLLAVDTDSKKMSIIEIDSPESVSRIQKSMQLKTPIDGKIHKKNGELYAGEYPSIGFLISAFFRPWEYSFDGMTPLDALKLTQYALGIQDKDVTRYEVSLNSDSELEGMTQDELYDTFKDPVLINEQQSIEVVNGTGKEGLAGQVSLLLKNTGGNVVSLGTSEEVNRSTLYSNQNSHTLTRISHILGISPEIDPDFASISDIKIILGKDFVKRIQ
ncbi:MAG: LytR C-terminal domain-containing protein [Candidatus Levybacteria bacterium]|nr:LytR C-terminal domain-containing protein [Candidatus Levybacteria bacterium]